MKVRPSEVLWAIVVAMGLTVATLGLLLWAKWHLMQTKGF